MDRLFKVFNIYRAKNREVTQFVLLKLKINRHIEWINAEITDLNNMNIFLGYNQLVKYNPEVNLNIETIQFTRCLRECKI